MIIGITGASGFVGKILAQQLSLNGEIVDILAADGRGRYRLNEASNIGSTKPNVLVHCALIRNTGKNEVDENLLGLQKLLDESKDNPKMRIIFISSLSSHSKSLSNYGQSKFNCEEFLHPLPHACVIRAGVITSYPSGGMEKLLTKLSNFPIILFSISNLNLYLTPITDLVDFISDFIQNTSHQDSKSVVLAEGAPISLTQFLKTKRSKKPVITIEISLFPIIKLISLIEKLNLRLALFDSIKSYSTPFELRYFDWKQRA